MGPDAQPRDYIEAHLDDTISLSVLAAEAALSLFHFCRVFEAAHGIAPAAYVRNCRVQRAKRLIEAGSGLAEAAVRAGFADQPHMTRQFRAALGVTPAQCRRSDCAGELPATSCPGLSVREKRC